MLWEVLLYLPSIVNHFLSTIGGKPCILLSYWNRGEDGTWQDLHGSQRTRESFMEDMTCQLKPVGHVGVWQTEEGQGWFLGKGTRRSGRESIVGSLRTGSDLAGLGEEQGRTLHSSYSEDNEATQGF